MITVLYGTNFYPKLDADKLIIKSSTFKSLSNNDLTDELCIKSIYTTFS